MQKYDPVKLETEMLEFWEKNKLRQTVNKKNEDGKPFYFLDGPPYTSGKIHLGTAWNKSIKDLVTRYKRMQGFDVWDRAGYDMHGLPVENKVQKKLGLKTKEEIVKYGLAKFVKECKEFAVGNLLQMNKDFKRIGVWLDFDNAYQTIANEYIEGTWWLVKKAHEKKRLYEGKLTTTWCGSCQTALAKHELEYYNVKDKSIFVKFKVKGKENEYLVIWTTTPWTIPYNLGIMANPNVDYVKAKVGQEVWILAKDLVDKVVKEKSENDYEIIEEFKGSKLEGLQYIHFMEDVLGHHYDELRKKAKKLHVVLMSEEYVTTEAGSGLVHMAPGCGGEDYEVGHKNGIPPFNHVNEEGFYDNTMGPFSNLHVKKHNDTFVESIDKYGALVAKETYAHDYGHCWRCKNPILYRTTTQWFFKVEDLIPKMRKLNKEKINWVPDWSGQKQFDDWLKNLRDNGITRQRFWGSPLPVWKCPDCNSYEVVESRKDLEKLNANKIPEDLHKPWIDEVTLPCSCGSTMIRNPDIMDVWIDAGVDSWASLGFPHSEENFKKLFPADFITEAKDQIRGWFNLLFVASMIGMDNISFKNCYMHGYINDAYGQKFSKSLGNYVSPQLVLEKFGADSFRFYVLGASNPGVDMNYNEDDLIVKRRNLGILWNLHNFVMDLSKTLDKNPEDIPDDLLQKADLEEKYVLSKLHSTIKKTTELLDNYKINEVSWTIEGLFMELSRTYVQLVRDKINNGTDEQKEIVLKTIYTVMKQVTILLAPVTPMICEKMYHDFKESFGLKLISVHLYDWPKHDQKLIDDKLEQNVESAKSVIQAILAAREKAGLGTRWPMQTVHVETKDDLTLNAAKELIDLIKSQTNVRNINVVNSFDDADLIIKPNFKTIGPEFGRESQTIVKEINDTSNSELLANYKDSKLKLSKWVLEDKHLDFERSLPDNFKQGNFPKGNIYLDTNVPDDLVSEGYYREVSRRVQTFRKNSGLHKSDKIKLYLKLDKALLDHIAGFSDDLKDRVGAETLEMSDKDPSDKYEHSNDENVKGLKFTIYF
jgi:isoleucyl-tRNA synthetase